MSAGVGLFLLAVALPLLRQQRSRSWQTLKAEDGFAFYQQAADEGALQVLFRDYNGYLVLPPRLFTTTATWVPVGDLAAYYAVLGSVVTALLAWFVYHVTRSWISSVPVRLALSALVVLMPAAGPENTASVTNTIWAFAMVTPWAIVGLAERGREVVVRSIVAFLGATGTPLGLLFLPLAISWVAIRRTRDAIVVSSIYSIGALLQLFTIATADTSLTGVNPDRPLGELSDLVLTRVYGVYLLGSEGAVNLWREYGLSFSIGASLVVTLLFTLAALDAGRRAQLLGVVFYLYAVVALLASVWGRGIAPFKFNEAGTLDPSLHIRYSVPATFLLASAFASVLAPTGDSSARVIARWGRPLFVVHVAVVILLSFTIDGYFSLGPTWRERVEEARTTCDSSEALETVDIPQDALRFWVVRVRCDEL